MWKVNYIVPSGSHVKKDILYSIVKQHTADLQLVALFPSLLVLVQFSAHKHRLVGSVYF